MDEFEELIFQAKFLVRTQEVMKRIGPGADGFEKLSTEFQSSVQKSVDALKILIDRAPEEISRKFTNNFFTRETESFDRLMKLMFDLSWIKNWQVDGKPLPYEVKPSLASSIQDDAKLQLISKRQEEGKSLLLSRIQRSAGLAMILFVFFLLIDPPVTILGWILSLGIAAFLVYIILQIYVLTRTPKS